MATILLCPNFKMPGDRFRLQSELSSIGMRLEPGSESASGNVNEQ